MSVGTLHAGIVLDEPGKIYRGHRDPVLGHIRLWYTPGKQDASTELFGLLQVFVTLHGRAKTKVWKPDDHTYRGRARLFSRTVLIYNKPFRTQPIDASTFPFSVNFPEFTDDARVDEFCEDSRFTDYRNHPLPPSFHDDYFRYSANGFEAFVEYRIGVNVVMPQLQLRVKKPNKYQEPVVGYEPAGASQPAEGRPFNWRGYVSVSNELLLPEADRPKGLRQKTRALFGAGNFPTHAFDWICLAPTDLYFGQPIRVELQIKPREEQCTAILVPEIRLRHFTIKLNGRTLARSHMTTVGCVLASRYYGPRKMRGVIDDRGPFSKASDNTKIITTRALGENFVASIPSFSTYNIAVNYTVEIKFGFELAGKKQKFQRAYPVTVHPPLEMPPSRAPAEDRPSSQVSDTGNMAFDLPRYEDLPPYEEKLISDK
ncbi:hypothetical protein F5X97DRAFT_28254 [Nemania serpens]|nr:hypothetical protein F5X97DRAFT_28254 [Nemania serpens]